MQELLGLYSRFRLLGSYLSLLPRLFPFRPGAAATVADRIERLARTRGPVPFVVFEDRQLTYEELDRTANRIAHWARGEGVSRGSVVALLMENRPEYVATWAGLAKLGATTALINTNLTDAGLRHALAAADAELLVLGSECIDRFATTAGDLERPIPVWIDRDPEDATDAPAPAGARELGEALAAQRDDAPDPSSREGMTVDDNLFYIYTSGTTGLPKAARFSHMRFLALGETWAHLLGLRRSDVTYNALPLYHTAGGVMVVSAVMAAGSTMALRRRFSARAFWDDVRRYDATMFQYIGEFCRYLLNQPPSPDDRRHRLRVIAGNGLRPDIWEELRNRFGIPWIVEFYGATEGNAALVNLENRVGSVGRVPFRFLSNARLFRYDVDADTHPRGPDGFCIECAPGEAGELLGWIPDLVMSPLDGFEGYTSKEATEKKILRNVQRNGDRWFRTGDLLRQDEEGFFYFVDRVGDTFRWKGENVSTQEVAEALSGHPAAAMVNVYGVEVPGHDGRAGMAAILLEKGATFDGEEFGRFVDGRLPRYAAPLFVRILEEVEVTGTFKVRKVNLQREGFDVSEISDPVWFRGAGETAYVPLTEELEAEVRAGSRKV